MVSLEQEQRESFNGDNSAHVGDNAELSEVAAPFPVKAHDDSAGDFEERQTRAVRDGDDQEEAGTRNQGNLTEMTVPSPVRLHNRSSDSTDEADHPRNNGVLEKGQYEGTDKTVSGKPSQLWLEVTSVSWIVFFSILGTLARLGVEAITTYPYAPVSSPVLWANLGGSFFIGFLLEDRRLFRFATGGHLVKGEKEQIQKHIDRKKKVLPLYVGLATGFCGSFTSFSTFITDAFLALTNTLPGPSPVTPYQTVSGSLTSRNGGYSFMATLAVLIIHTAVSVSALKSGAHLAAGLQSHTPSVPAHIIHDFLDPIAVFLGAGSWLGAILLAIFPPHIEWRRHVLFSLVFAPPGALVRFYLAKWFNARVPSFPLGTFAANILGTVVEGMCYDLQHARSVVGPGGIGAGVSSPLASACGVLEGVMQGFCGCTTTVSTWVAELNGLKRRHAWTYGLISVGVALGLQVVIMGSQAWTVGFDQSCTA